VGIHPLLALGFFDFLFAIESIRGSGKVLINLGMKLLKLSI
jgi:hypothetical protein